MAVHAGESAVFNPAERPVVARLDRTEHSLSCRVVAEEGEYAEGLLGGQGEVVGDTHGGRPSAFEEPGQVVAVFKDTGMGIPPDEQDKIWTRLYRGDKSRSQRGLGLGLSLVKAIVETHDGRVTVSSKPGEGAEFIVTLPKESKPAALPPVVEPPPVTPK